MNLNILYLTSFQKEMETAACILREIAILYGKEKCVLECFIEKLCSHFHIRFS